MPAESLCRRHRRFDRLSVSLRVKGRGYRVTCSQMSRAHACRLQLAFRSRHLKVRLSNVNDDIQPFIPCCTWCTCYFQASQQFAFAVLYQWLLCSALPLELPRIRPDATARTHLKPTLQSRPIRASPIV